MRQCRQRIDPSRGDDLAERAAPEWTAHQQSPRAGSTLEETFRGQLPGRTPDREPSTLIVTWQGWGTNGRVWLTFNGANRTTVVLTDSEATEWNRPGSVKALMRPGLSGVGLLDDHSSQQIGRPVHMPKSYPPEFCRKVLDLVASGRRVTQVTADLDLSEQCIHSWRRQRPFDSGQIDGVASADQAEMVVVRRRIAELEPEVEIRRRAVQLLQTFGPSPLGQLIL